MNTFYRNIAIALLVVGISGTSAHAGILGDVVGKVGGKVLGLDGVVGGSLKLRQQRLENADNFRRCTNLYGVEPCQRVWAGKL
jgi:hypothetical protein